MWRYIVLFILTILTASVIFCQVEVKLQQTSTECGVLRVEQLYNLEKSVQDTEFPWMGILKGVDGDSTCHSVLIDRQFLLTAAHCFEFSRSSAFTVELGKCKAKEQCTLTIDVETYKHHPKHVLNNALHDISLIKLKEPVTFTDYIRPICLPSADTSGIHYATQHLTMTGQQFKGRLNLKIPVFIVDSSTCQLFYQSVNDLDESILCGAACDNGSHFILGSALMGITLNSTRPDRYYLTGILTNGPNSCKDITPDLFQRIDHHMDWITETMAKLEATA